jgi:hypothetical protein
MLRVPSFFIVTSQPGATMTCADAIEKPRGTRGSGGSLVPGRCWWQTRAEWELILICCLVQGGGEMNPRDHQTATTEEKPMPAVIEILLTRADQL